MTAKRRKTVPALVKALDDPYARVRRAAIRALEAIGPSARAAIPVLKKIEENDPLFRCAQRALERIGG